jgi:hypothetical protein
MHHEPGDFFLDYGSIENSIFADLASGGTETPSPLARLVYPCMLSGKTDWTQDNPNFVLILFSSDCQW